MLTGYFYVQVSGSTLSVDWIFLCTGVWEYIEDARDSVRDLEQRVQKSKDNVDEIKKLMATWDTLPLFERKEVKHECLMSLDDREERLTKR